MAAMPERLPGYDVWKLAAPPEHVEQYDEGDDETYCIICHSRVDTEADDRTFELEGRTGPICDECYESEFGEGDLADEVNSNYAQARMSTLAIGSPDEGDRTDAAYERDRAMVLPGKDGES